MNNAFNLLTVTSVLAAASIVFAAATDTPLPSSEIPGSSPAGKMPEGSSKSERRPTPAEPTPIIRGLNFPAPESVDPKKGPNSPEPLPGSGRRDIVPGS